MTPDEYRRNVADRIKNTHRRQKDGSSPARVTVLPNSEAYDIVRIEYADGEIREFERLAPPTREEE